MLVAIVGGILAPATAAADPVASSRSELAQLQAQIRTDALDLHQLTVAYNADALQAGELGQQAAAAAQRVQALRAQEQQNRAVVLRVAVMSYTGEIQTAATINLSPLVSGQYLDATMGNISDSEDQLRAEERQTDQQLTQLRQASQNQSDQLRAAAAARQQALSQAVSDQQALEVDQQRLNALLAAVPAPSLPAQVQGLGTGLVSAVRSEVSPSTTTAPAAATAPVAQSTPATSPPGSSLTKVSTTPGTTKAPPVASTRSTVGPTTVVTTRVTTPPVTTPPVTSAPPTTAPPSTGGGAGGPWLALRNCESGDNYQENTGNGFYGAYQFSWSTWTGLGFPGRPDLEPPAMQDEAAMRLQSEAGWGQWPACSAVLGLG